MTELPKTFDPAAIESRWYAHWEREGLFRPARDDQPPFTIVMPPPNVTGALHIGHALDNTLQDILVRHARLQGKDALWVVGTDHAGIATQMVVERQLDAEGKKRTDFSREEFIERVWTWKRTSGGQITQQLRRLGASCDWANERFTMDEGFSKAVTHVFVELHKRGLLYRDKRLVNWDPKFQTAISDLEVETREVQGKFWTLRYPLADGSGSVEVATTRPETMLADMAVAVHPTDERYTALVGKMVKLPITGRLIAIVADEHADAELGSGAVKITPGHDFNDYEVGKRAGYKPGEMLNMLDGAGRIAQTSDDRIPADLIGLDRFDARKKVVELLDASGALVKVEDRTIATPYGDRSGVVIEPYLTDQWYVDAAKLAGPAIEAVKSGAIKIVPESWAKTWFNWLENIQPWCVSRQLWWGHRIPAWFDAKGNIFVATTIADAQSQAGEGVELRQDDDVLDTWFSSARGPFATLGWPFDPPRHGEVAARSADGGGSPLAATPLHHPADGPPPRAGEDLRRHYPNDVLISGFDILFFWDARMAMQGIEFMGAPPWKTLYLHGLVRDATGAKMSKSKGNAVDPLGLIDRYGADALRFTMAAMESQGRDIKLDEKRVEGYRNFATKLWNAARFLQGNGVGASSSIAAPPATLPVNRWIIGEVVETLAKMDQALAYLRFDEAANAIYQFTWATFCDWYVELVKGEFNSVRPELVEGLALSETMEEENAVLRQAQDERASETHAVAAWAFDQILVMLHPLMPFITEELWHAMGERPYDLIVAKWPEPDARADLSASQSLKEVINLISEVRSVRSEFNLPWSETLRLQFADDNDDARTKLFEHAAVFQKMTKTNMFQGRAGSGPFNDSPEPMNSMFVRDEKGIQIVVDGRSYIVVVPDTIDLDAERSRLSKAIAAAAKDRDSLASRLANPAFAERAKPEAVEKARADHDARAAEAKRLSAALARLG
ncbi:valine--tRNA ligase [Sphingomonas sp.]|uniref:valine--tRNA ligase n=1 Tax=Sphingomonas sp. TaxID=28214 RepID=UPI00286C3609|nr:valine--tRNA ligase [Sphingomonas sp.]